MISFLILLFFIDFVHCQVTCASCDRFGFGVRGTSKWCQCCKLNCGGFQQACIDNDGFCVTRCLTTDGGIHCGGTTLPPSPPTTVTTPMPTPMPVPPTTATPGSVTIDCAVDCPGGNYGLAGTARWCKCCGGNCGGGFMADCIRDNDWCVAGSAKPGGRCYERVPGLCPPTTPTPAPTPLPTTMPVTPAPTPVPTPVTTSGLSTMLTTSDSTSALATTTTASTTPATTTASQTTNPVTTTTKPVTTTQSEAQTTESGQTTETTIEATDEQTTLSGSTGSADSCFPLQSRPGFTGLNNQPCAAVCEHEAFEVSSWDTATTLVGVGGLVTAAFALITLLVGVVLTGGSAFRWHWPHAAIALILLGVGLALSLLHGRVETWCDGDQFNLSTTTNDVCLAQGSLVYVGGLAGALWLLFAVLQAISGVNAVINSTASSAAAARRSAANAVASVPANVLIHFLGWIVPIVGMVIALVTEHIGYPRADYGLWCFVHDEDILWPWTFFFGPMLLVALITLISSILLLIKRSSVPSHHRRADWVPLAVVALFCSILYILWGVSRLVLDVQSTYKEREIASLNRVTCHFNASGNCDEAYVESGAAPDEGLWMTGACAAAFIGLLLPLLLIGVVGNRSQDQEDVPDDGLDMKANDVYGDTKKVKKQSSGFMSSKKQKDEYQSNRDNIFGEDDFTSSDTDASLSIRILDDDDSSSSSSSEKFDSKVLANKQAAVEYEQLPPTDTFAPDTFEYEAASEQVESLTDSTLISSSSSSIVIAESSIVPRHEPSVGDDLTLSSSHVQASASYDYSDESSSDLSGSLSDLLDTTTEETSTY